MKRSPTIPRILFVPLAVGLVFLLPACGAFGGNGDGGDDGKFPEPPDRPEENVHAMNPGPSQGAASVSVPSAHRS